MLFFRLFKTPTGSQDSIKKIENSLFLNHSCLNLAEYRDQPVSIRGFLSHDRSREFDLVNNLSKIKYAFFDLKLMQSNPRSIIGFDANRDLDLLKIYSLISKNYIIADSATKLKEVFKSKEVDHFLYALTINPYTFSEFHPLSSGTQCVISLKEGFYEL